MALALLTRADESPAAEWADNMEEESRRKELRELGKAKIAELVAECERDGWEYEFHEVTPQLINPPVSPG